MDKQEKEKEKYNYTPLIIFSILTIIGGFALYFFYIKNMHINIDMNKQRNSSNWKDAASLRIYENTMAKYKNS
jgi:hypothetical protein